MLMFLILTPPPCLSPRASFPPSLETNVDEDEERDEEDVDDVEGCEDENGVWAISRMEGGVGGIGCHVY
ncbi:hypothetical protein JOQ06_013704 [Pogonophryne albipinna]|uniref:Uncharacterized protein n=1 Tax=Pogonophryne albipinna TaxID=1090488 RepID=A0AAD6BN69_9TELE|nr:hypothetical protein JOQ06_013704 [Pogonophryne albipinna]